MKKFLTVALSLLFVVNASLLGVSALDSGSAASSEEQLEPYTAETSPEESTEPSTEPTVSAPVLLSRQSITLGAGESFKISASLGDGSTSTYTWQSSDSAVVSVSSSNDSATVSAKSAGTATVTATAENGQSASCTVTVKNAPSSISLNKTSITLGVGETFDLNSSVPSGCAAYSVKYTSDKSSVASVKSAGGLVTAKSVGTATVTATAYNGKKVTCAVTVKKAPTSITLNKTSLTLGVGETFDLDSYVPSGSASYSRIYSTDRSGIASVKASGGLVTAQSVGSATITVKTYNGKTATCAVTVKKAPSSVSLNKTSITLGVGETFDLDSKLPSNTASRVVSYSSGNSKIASVKAAGGLVTAKAEGTATITATTYNGKTATCAVTVKKAPTSITLNKTSVTLGVGETFDLDSFVSGGSASYKRVYSSNKTSVATVKASGGLVTAKSVGTAKITVKTYNGKTATCAVTVKKLANSVSISKTSLKMMVGETYDLNSTVPSGSAAYYRGYTSDNKNVASVAFSGGLVTAKAKGTANITVALTNNKSVKSTCKITVVDSGTKKTATAATTLRAEPSWASKTVANVSKGATVYQYDKSSDGRWLKVKSGSNYGWIYNKAFGVSKNYSKINTSTLPVVADDILFNTGTSIKSIFNYCYNIPYQRGFNDTTENLCVQILSNGRGACYHHAAILYYLLDRAGYETLIVNGIDDYTGGGPHAWCMIKTDGKWRHIDPTAIIGLNPFYLVTDKTIDPYFTWDRNKYPAAK